MKIFQIIFIMNDLWRQWRHRLGSAFACCLLLAFALDGTCVVGEAQATKTFATPEDAAASLVSAVKALDPEELRSIFGPALADIENPDRIQATNDFLAFGEALGESSHITHTSDTKCILEVGTNSWPFPIPIVRREGRWLFDTAAGKEELLNRRIGKNELATLQVVRAYVEAQREYASRDRDGDQVLEYAQKLNSSPEKEDGLYWPPGPDGEASPLGPLVAYAQGEGYALESKGDDEVPAPFHGYFYKILTRQGRHAPGGKYDYIINGNMIGGFALVAWPARFGDSGIMTFIVNQQGVVYQKDLGAKTSKLAAGMKAYDPDATWVRSPD